MRPDAKFPIAKPLGHLVLRERLPGRLEFTGRDRLGGRGNDLRRRLGGGNRTDGERRRQARGKEDEGGEIRGAENAGKRLTDFHERLRSSGCRAAYRNMITPSGSNALPNRQGPRSRPQGVPDNNSCQKEAYSPERIRQPLCRPRRRFIGSCSPPLAGESAQRPSHTSSPKNHSWCSCPGKSHIHDLSRPCEIVPRLLALSLVEKSHPRMAQPVAVAAEAFDCAPSRKARFRGTPVISTSIMPEAHGDGAHWLFAYVANQRSAVFAKG